MRINNPKLFNGDLLATKKQITEWLLGTSTESFAGKLATGVIPITGVSAQDGLFPIYGSTISLTPNDATTISGKFAAIDTAIETITGDIQNVKLYEVSGLQAIGVTSSATTVGDTPKDIYTVKLTTDTTTLTQDNNTLAVKGSYVSGVVDENILNKLTIVRTTDDIASGNTAEYTLTYNGNPIPGASTINIPKDQFLKDVKYNSSTKKLTFTFNVEDGTQITDVDLSGLIDTYNAASGITKTTVDNVDTFVGVVDGNSDSYLTVGATGFKLTGVSARFDGIDDDIDYISSFVSGLPAADTALSNKIDYVSSFVSGLPAADTALSNKIDYVSSFVSGLPADITDVNNDVAYISSFVSGLPTDISYVSSFVSGLPADIIDVNNDVAYISSFVSGLPADITDVNNDVAYISSFVSGLPTDISYVSGVVDTISGDLYELSGKVTNANKFVEVTGTIETASTTLDKVDDTLYYNSFGQTMIWDGNAWHNISMEALTTLDGAVNDTTTATSKAIKDYVDDTITPVRQDLNTVSGNLNTLSTAVDTKLPKKAEIFVVTKEFGGTSQTSAATVTGRVIAVYAISATNGSNVGDQVYPEINYNSETGVSTITATDITASENYKVVYLTADEQ